MNTLRDIENSYFLHIIPIECTEKGHDYAKGKVITTCWDNEKGVIETSQHTFHTCKRCGMPKPEKDK